MRATTINMVQALLERGRGLWEQDRYEEASRVLSRLLGLRSLPADVAERAQFYLGDIQLAQGHYSKARRHLAAAIGSGMAGGETHFLMACALEWDDESDLKHAYRHYRRAVELEPGQPLYSSAYALMRIRCKPDRSKQDREALRRLRDAFTALPDDRDIVYNYVFGLMEMGRMLEAEIALRRANKRWPNDPAFEGLWHQYLTKRGFLPRTDANEPRAPKLRIVDDEPPVILRFPAERVASPGNLGSTCRLKLSQVLGTLPGDELLVIERTLRLPPQQNLRRRRQEIRRTLLDRPKLLSLVARLSVASRHVIQVLSNEGGSAEIKRLRLRVDGPSARRPHFARVRTRTLDELRQNGLVYRAGEAHGQTAADRVLIPTDLGRMLSEIMASLQ